MSKIYYNFSAPSALSFAVVHGGRRFFVNFSACTDGVSRYLTNDRKLAEKIIAHRWFRQGLIKLDIEEEKEESQVIPANPVESKESILKTTPQTGFLLSSLKAEGSDASSSKTTSDNEYETSSEEKPDYSIDDVSSFIEARQYMIDVLGVTSPIKSREDLLNLCKQHGIDFPNYPL